MIQGWQEDNKKLREMSNSIQKLHRGLKKAIKYE